MRKLLFVLAVTGLAAHAHPGPKRGGFCAELNLTDAQKTQLKDAHLKFADERIDLEAKEKHARLDLRKLIGAKDSDERAIRKAAQAAADASSKLHQADELNKVDTLLKVFKSDQREQAEHCFFGMRPRFDFGPPRGPGRFADETQGPQDEAFAFSPPPPRPDDAD